MQDLLAGNAAFARDFDGAGMPAVPARRLAVVACMDVYDVTDGTLHEVEVPTGAP